MATWNEQLQEIRKKSRSAAASGAGAASLIKDPSVSGQLEGVAMKVTAPPKTPAQTGAASNPATSSPRPAMAIAPPKVSQQTASAPVGAQPFGGTPAMTDPAMVGGQAMLDQRAALTSGAPAPTITPPPPVETPAEAQLKALQQSYLGTLSPSAEEQAVSRQYGDVASTAAQQAAAARQAYSDRVGAINDQATLQPFLTGRQAQASGELANQLAALKSGTEAQSAPLASRLAALQAQRTGESARAEAELGLAQPNQGVEPVSVGAGSSLVNPVTGEAIFQAPFAPKETADPSSVREYEYARSQGYGGTFEDFRKSSSTSQDVGRLLTPAELQLYGAPAGTTFADVIGMSPKKPLTEAQQKSLGFGSRMSEANPIIDSLSEYVVNASPIMFSAALLAEPSTIGNTFVPDQVRQVRQAERNFLNAVLRRESGAVINPSEFDNGAKQYFPRPGDDAGTLAQKAQNRNTSMSTMLQGIKQTSEAPSSASGDESFDW